VKGREGEAARATTVGKKAIYRESVLNQENLGSVQRIVSSATNRAISPGIALIEETVAKPEKKTEDREAVAMSTRGKH